MAKSGQARVLTPVEFHYLLEVIESHRHPEKNTAIIQLLFKLGLRAQECSLLQIKEVARLGSGGNFKLLKILSLPASYTKGANAMNCGRSNSTYQRKKVSFTTDAFNSVVKQIEALAKAGAVIDPTTFYPAVRTHNGKSRDLPMVDDDLRASLIDYLRIRIEKDPHIRPSDPLFITQKGTAYSPNTLQEHVSLMLRGWAGIEKAASHSGRRSLLTSVLEDTSRTGRNNLKVAQKIAGHISAATTLIYDDPSEADLVATLVGVGEKYKQQ